MSPDALSAGRATSPLTHPNLWWERPDLTYQNGRLTLGGHDLLSLARQAGGPAYFYSGQRVIDNLQRIRAALTTTGLPFAIRYAMKANRYGPLLTWMRASGLCGIDACSPGELRHAVACGFSADQVSYTATSVSDADLAVLARHPAAWINCDSLSTIRRLGALAPGRRIGLRVNPAMGVGYGENQLLRYSGEKTSKFGIYREHFAEALETAARFGLRVEGIHFHVGCGYLNGQLSAWSEVVKECLWFLDQLPEARLVNLGGGLGLPHVATDRPLDLQHWADIIRSAFSSRGVEIWVEPGDYVVKDAGVLVLQVNTVEQKRGTRFVGLDGGFNLAMEPVFYRLPCEPVPASIDGDRADAWAADRLQRVTIAGNINEALDIWADGIDLPPLAEGDHLVLLNAGGYASAMSSNHCMRAQAVEHLLI
jgi:diaminopimelate decarboxylase